MMKRVVPGLILVGCMALFASCDGDESREECKQDGDCPAHWRCDMYAKVCRCVSDEGCNEAADEVCMPDGTCQVYTGCTSDSMCPFLWRCEVSTGECLCTTDEACPTGEICNASGYCQPSAGCFDNEDCGQGEICNTIDKKCIPAGTCESKFQCPIGNLCTNGQCVPGCVDYGDCPLRWACIEGQCMQGVCEDDSFCDFLEYCSDGNCLNAYSDNTPYCKPCDNVTEECGLDGNRCLIYPYTDDAFAAISDEYCAVDCSGGQRCPNGFWCSIIVVVDPFEECRSDADCPQGAPCMVNPEDQVWYCACNDATNPCPMDLCWLGTCMTKQIPCNTSADCTIVCEKDPGVDYGGCVIGANCGLITGFRCPPP